MDILAAFICEPYSNIELYPEDWLSAYNGLDIVLRQNGWEIDEEEYSNKIDKINLTVSSYSYYDDSQSKYRWEKIIIHGECEKDYDPQEILKIIVTVLNNRFISISGKLFLTDKYTSEINKYIVFWNDKIQLFLGSETD